MKILILGGTAEGRQLANRLVARGHEVISSLAGRTQDPILPEGEIRMGGFGGPQGLSAYLRATQIEVIVDATHPYAGLISINAVAAAEASGIKLVRYMRPEWKPLPRDRWTMLETAQAAADALPSGARVLLTTGHAGLETYLERDDCRFLVRLIEVPEFEMPGHAELLQMRPPYEVASEVALLRRHEITHLITKNSGGKQTSAKLEAARQVGVQVFMLARPVYGPALEVATIVAAIAALES